MSVEQFLERLEQAGLLDDTVLADVRRQVAASPFAPAAQAVADALVKKGQLTSFQAGKLLQEAEQTSAATETGALREQAAELTERASQAVAAIAQLDPEVLLEVLEMTPQQVAEADAYGVFGKRRSDPALVKAVDHRIDNLRRVAAAFRARATRKTGDRARNERLLSHVERLAKELDTLQKFLLGTNPAAEAARALYEERGQGAAAAATAARPVGESSPGSKTSASRFSVPPRRETPTKPVPTVDEDLGLAPQEDDEPPAPAPPSPPAKPVPQPAAELGLVPDEGEEEVVLLEDATGSAPPLTVAIPKGKAGGPKASEVGLQPLDALPGLVPLDDAAGLPPAAGVAGRQPVGPTPGLSPLPGARGLPPLGATPGLQPLASAAGLQPLEPVTGLPPLAGAAGLQPLEPVAGLSPLGAPSGLQPLGGTAGLEPLDVAAGLLPVAGGIDQPGRATAGLQPLGAPKPVTVVAAKPPRKSKWETPLMLVGGGALLLLLIVGLAIYFSLQSGSADEMFQLANTDYRAQAYGQAQAKFEKFLAQFPDDPKVSEARVKIATGRLWQLLESSSDKRAALAELGTVLPQIETEKAFSEVSEIRAELATILPDIAKAFATPAKTKTDAAEAQELVDRAVEAMKYVDNPAYIPSSLRKTIEKTLTAIQEDIDTAKRNINQSQRLGEAVAGMRTAVEAGQTSEAYDIRRKLLKEYPALEANAALNETVQRITQRQRDLVRSTDETLTAQTADRARSVQFQLALASRTTKTAAPLDKQVVCFLARGAVFGLQAGTGQLLWRRFVGHEPGCQPRPVSDVAGADVVAVDVRQHELLRLKAETGQLVWRLPLQEPLLEPVVRGARIIVATRSGSIRDVHAETGRPSRRAVIPQPLPVPPCPTSKPGRLYQVGEHSNLYVLDERTLECQEVYYLGHKAGTVAVAPVSILGHLFVAENGGEDYCDLHVLAADADGLNLKPALKPFRLKGRVVSPPCAARGRLIVVTDLGETRVLEVNPANAKQPVIDAVEPIVAAYRTPLIGYPTYDAERLWVAHDRLTKYEIQPSTSRMLRRSLQYEGDVFQAPPRVVGDVVFHLRRREKTPAFTVAATGSDSDKLLWEVDLAVPTVLLASDASKNEIHAVSAQAELFDVTVDALQSGRLDQPASVPVGAARTASFVDTVPLGDGRWVLASPQNHAPIVLYDPQAVSAAGRLKPVKLPAAGSVQVTSSPVAFGGGILLAWDNGQVALIDPATGENKAAPFQPRVAAGEKVRWQRAAVLGSAEFVIADDRRRLYRIALQDQPQPQLVLRKEVTLEVDIAAPLAAVGDTVYAVVRGPTGDVVKAFATAALTPGQEWPLEGRVAWGPEPVADQVLVASDGGRLFCMRPGEKRSWTTPLPYGALVGTPLRVDQDLVLASAQGTVWRVSGADGKELGKFEVGEPLGTGAVLFKTRWLASGSDGTLYVFVPVTPAS